MIETFKKKNKNEKLFFRIHWSGDLFSEDYTIAWSKVIKQFPEVRFWAYTRSYWWVKHLRDLPNLTLFLSADPQNYTLVKAVYEKNKDQKNFSIAYMGNDPPKDYKFITCPEITGKVKNTPERGACSRCKMCVDNYRDRVKFIHFPIH